MFAKREVGKQSFSKPLDGTDYPPELIQSFILGRLRDDAHAKLGRPIKGAVIAVPAHFNEPKRRATIDAATLAGIETLAIINEPTAAAIAYGLDSHFKLLGPQTALIYDLGGGTFDVSIVHVAGPTVEVKACDGNAMLGGMDWDKCLIAWLDQEFQEHHRVQPSRSPDGQAMLAAEAQDIKPHVKYSKECQCSSCFQR